MDFAAIWDAFVDSFLDLLGQFFFENFSIFQNAGVVIWDFFIGLTTTSILCTPQEFSTHTWAYIINNVLNFTMAVGGTFLNVFFMVGILRQSTNLKDNFTLETFVDNVIKMLFANLLIINGVPLIETVFELTEISSSYFLTGIHPPSIEVLEYDAGNLLFELMFGGIIFCIVSFVCSFTIFLTVYQRYLTLYLLVALYPIAMSTIPGGNGVSNTASSWARAFLGKSFEVVVIAIAIAVASRMCQSIDFGSLAGEGMFDGFTQIIQSMSTMVILAGAVKGVDGIMQRALHL